MGPNEFWRYHDQWVPRMHHGPPAWADAPSPVWATVVSLLPLLLLLWVLVRWYLLTGLVDATRRAVTARRDTVRPRWDAAVARQAETARAYAAFECDPVAVLERPALADVTEPATARFVDAFAEATALATEAYPGRAAGERFVAAVERAARAWTAAVEAADRIRVAKFGSGERALVDQALALLALARSSPHEAERRGAYARARSRLGDLERRTGWALPRPAGELMATRARGMLDAA